MAYESDQRFLVLHAVRVRGFAEAGVLAARSQHDVADVEVHLAALAADDLVSHRDGPASGWWLTSAGRAAHLVAMAAELESAGCRDSILVAYEVFLELNASMLGICTDWQLRTVDGTQVANDHADAAHDSSVIDRLVGISDRARPVCRELTSSMSRFEPYGRRLATATRRVLDGDGDWVTSPRLDSCHTVWAELHEDLLVTLGIERGQERTKERTNS